ncbi:MAG: molybdenum cofactor guanylyltransferase [Actinomycetota bacterium]
MSGLVLAGGASRRMGRDKALIPFEGELLVVRAVRLLEGVCGEVLVASGDGHRFDSLGLRQVADSTAGVGPMAGMVAGIEAAEAAGYPLVAVIAVDMPLANPALLCLLGELWAGEAGVVPELAGGIEPLHALYHAHAAAPLRSAIEAGSLSVRQAVASLPRLRVVGRSLWGPLDRQGTFARNLNSPGDLAP